MTERKISTAQLLRTVAKAEGFSTVASLLDRYVIDGCVPGICVTCGETIETSCEPDAEDIPCDACGTRTVRSILVLAGIV